MPMTPDLMAAEMIAAIESVGDKTNRLDVFKALASAIITHIQTNATAVALVVTATAPPGGGPVVGTATGAPGCIQ